MRPGSAVPLPPVLPSVLLARDLPADVVAERRRRRELVPLVRGAYLPGGTRPAPGELALARAVAVHHRLRIEHWLSHETAALVHGLPVWRTPLATHLRTWSRAGTRADPTVRRHVGPVPGGHTATVAGLPVTSCALTAADCARTLDVTSALVVLDAALRAGATVGEVAALLEAAPGSRGVRRARRLLPHADAGAESAPETVTRLVLLRAGLPTPVTQLAVPTRRGVFWADLGVPELRLLVEYDGRPTYADADALYQEKLREDALRAEGWTVVRVVASDLRDPAPLLARLASLTPHPHPHPRPHLLT